ncbi:hypothetical protein [Paractinoplanes ovalisporus]|nr:hypothetical protein [Actinoplanes ovalisporus]
MRYQYVGPPEIREEAGAGEPAVPVCHEGEPPAVEPVASGFPGGEPVTYVVGLDGWLRLAPRRSEHVVLARGEDVLAAGEMTFDVDGRRVLAVSNQSTGYCPDPDCWPAVAEALDRLGVGHPGDFTDKLIFRRCPDCGERNVVRDGDFICALCDGELPAWWNFGPPPAADDFGPSPAAVDFGPSPAAVEEG